MKIGFFSQPEVSLNFEGKNLSANNFQNQALRNANFKDAILEEVNFEGAILEGANFEGATLKNANMQDATITYAKGLTAKELSQVNFNHIIVGENDSYNTQVVAATLKLKKMRLKLAEAKKLNEKLKSDFFRFIEQEFNQEPLQIPIDEQCNAYSIVKKN